MKAAIDTHLQLEMETGGYEAAAAAAPAIDRTYADTAQLIGAKAHNIAIVSSATAARMHGRYPRSISRPAM